MALTVEQLYQEYAGRQGDPGGVSYFNQLFGPTIEPAEVARFQTAIAEARAQGSEPAPVAAAAPAPVAAAAPALTVEQLYQQYAGRPADPGGINYFNQLFGAEIDPSEVARFQTAIAEARAQGSEEAAAAPTNLSVRDLYTQYAGRAGDVGGIDYFSQLFGPEIDSNEVARFQTAVAEARLQGSEPATAAQRAAARITADAAARALARRQGAIGAQERREDVAARLRAEGMLNPFANAMQGIQPNTRGTYTSIPIGVQSFDQNFQNYINTPLGAQYNPGVTGGVSPYSAVMNQMQDFSNPYAGITANQPIGGYNPNIYDPDLLSRFVQQRANDGALAAVASDPTLGGFNGGLITKVMGPKPPTPDDGTMFVQKGEYIIKRDSVDKYGKNLLDMVNEGKVPVAKMKSLLK